MSGAGKQHVLESIEVGNKTMLLIMVEGIGFDVGYRERGKTALHVLEFSGQEAPMRLAYERAVEIEARRLAEAVIDG